MMNSLLERFCRYVKVETSSNESSSTYPSTANQRNLAEILVEELRALGLQANLDEHSIVSALIPAANPEAPTIAWLAHMDTYPDVSGKDVKPQVIESYSGGDIRLDSDRKIPASDLERFIGKTIITTDGSTLLGADDKSGIAIIMTAAEQLLADPKRKNGPIKVIFTCDEEIGRGTDKLDIAQINAACAYTVDGEEEGDLDFETFSADLATIRILGQNFHTSVAFGKMHNALRAAAKFIEQLPVEISPERTKDREPFIHPYKITGDVGEVNIKMILRSFDTANLGSFAELLGKIASKIEQAMPGIKVEVEVSEQYRNMRDYLGKEPRALALAEKAYRNLGIEPNLRSVRGGTDGSRLSEKGLPTPNIFAGMHNFHSELEFACLEEMEKSVQVLLELASLWGAEKKPRAEKH